MATAPEDEAPELSEQGRRRLGIAVGFNTALVPTAITIIVPALPQLTAELKTDPPTAALNLTLYAAISGVQPLLAGPLSDRIGRRPVLLCSHLLPCLPPSSLLEEFRPFSWENVARNLEKIQLQVLLIL